MALSPDGSTLYVGGIFDHVNGVARNDLAAFNTATGALTSWAPSTVPRVHAIAVSPDGSSIYIGGAFGHMNGKVRHFAAAVNTSGKLLPWAPVLDSTVYALAVTPDDSQVLLGGYFQHINGVSQNSAGAVDPVNGTTNLPWSLSPTFLPHNSGCKSSVKDIVVSGSTAYFADEGNGGGCFDGDSRLSLGSTDSLLWQNDCLGATQALAVVNGFLFKGSHAHDCAYSPGGFPQVRPGTCRLAPAGPVAHRRHAWALDTEHQRGQEPPLAGHRRPGPARDGHRRQPAVCRRGLHHRQRHGPAGHRDLPDRARTRQSRRTRPPRRR